MASYEESSNEKGVGQPPMPPIDNPELALVLAGVPDSLTQTGGNLYAVIINVAVNAWMGSHIHGTYVAGRFGHYSRGVPCATCGVTGTPGCSPRTSSMVRRYAGAARTAEVPDPDGGSSR
ncbi:hypothetical protein ACWEQ7_34025 [Streptomyces sp. NPDC004069]